MAARESDGKCLGAMAENGLGTMAKNGPARESTIILVGLSTMAANGLA